MKTVQVSKASKIIKLEDLKDLKDQDILKNEKDKTKAICAYGDTCIQAGVDHLSVYDHPKETHEKLLNAYKNAQKVKFNKNFTLKEFDKILRDNKKIENKSN